MTGSTAPLSGPASGPSAGRPLRVHALTTGHVRVREAQLRGVGPGGARRLNVLRDKQWTGPLPIHAWAIEHPEGVILVDTGEVAAGSDPRHYPALNPYLRRATRFDITREDEIDAQLRRAGLSVDQVRWVVITHLHTDHAGGLCYFRDAEIVMSREEWESARGVRGRGRGYLPRFFPSWLRPRTVELRGNPVGPFPASYPLTGAGDVLLVPTRGHTFGHLSVIVEQPGEPRLVLAGDASYRQDLMLDGVVDGVAAGERAARETLGRLQRYVREQPTVYLPAHDPGSNGRFSAKQIVPA